MGAANRQSAFQSATTTDFNKASEAYSFRVSGSICLANLGKLPVLPGLHGKSWISVPEESELVQQGYANTAPIVQHAAEYQELLSDSHDILYTLADSMAEEITFQHDHDWTLFPEVGHAAKGLGYEEWAFCLAICPSQSVWAVGMAGQQKKRLQAARLAMSVALAAMHNTTDKKLRDSATRSPAFISFCKIADINVEDSVPHPALAPSQRHTGRAGHAGDEDHEGHEGHEGHDDWKWNKKSQPKEWNKESWSWGDNENRSDWQWKDWKDWKDSNHQDEGAYEADPENGEAEEEPFDETTEAQKISAFQEEAEEIEEWKEAEEPPEGPPEEPPEEPAEEPAKEPAEEATEEPAEEPAEELEEFQVEPEELVRPEEPEADAEEAEPQHEKREETEGLQEEFEEVLAEALEAGQDAMEDALEEEPEEVKPPPPKRQRQARPEPLKRDAPHWIYLEQMPGELQDFGSETLVLASDGARKGDMYSQAEKALNIMIGDLASEVQCHDDPNWKKFPEVGAELKLLAEKKECFTVVISPTRCLWGVGVSMKRPVRQQAAMLALAVQVALQTKEMGEEIPDLSATKAVADFLEGAQAARDELLPSFRGNN
ncbi:unnamed protein product [Cladocopium goreaui]|uniref:Tubulin alpha-3 chain n=1 Tax=Cladocopium goreaui TaxID=2562237 RepID=A0A9P1FWP9_9DINO|nr:unnamed protein product [Cladocopium goreaui]